jgi:hypothetical protein
MKNNLIFEYSYNIFIFFKETMVRQSKMRKTRNKARKTRRKTRKSRSKVSCTKNKNAIKGGFDLNQYEYNYDNTKFSCLPHETTKECADNKKTERDAKIQQYDYERSFLPYPINDKPSHKILENADQRAFEHIKKLNTLIYNNSIATLNDVQDAAVYLHGLQNPSEDHNDIDSTSEDKEYNERMKSTIRRYEHDMNRINT